MKIVAILLSLFTFASAASAGTCETNGYTIDPQGTVTHQASGLTWKRCPEGFVLDDANTSGIADDRCVASAETNFTWSEARALAQGSRFAGRDDWRLPQVTELATIADPSCGVPQMNTQLFPAVPRDWGFWSASTQPRIDGYAMVLSFHDASRLPLPVETQHRVRLVRLSR